MKAAVVLVLACGSPPAPIHNTPAVPYAPHEVMATIERTGCLGWCPIYKVTIYRDGVVDYHGEQFVKIKGDVQGRVDPSVIAKLDRLFAEANYVKLKDEYSEYDVTDNPSAITSYKPQGGREKHVEHYYGDHTAPKELDRLESAIDEAIAVERWIGTEQERRKLNGY